MPNFVSVIVSWSDDVIVKPLFSYALTTMPSLHDRLYRVWLPVFTLVPLDRLFSDDPVHYQPEFLNHRSYLYTYYTDA